MKGPVLSVWAPNAKCVAAIIGEVEQPMVSGVGGWWETSAPVQHGSTYQFLIDGQGPFPDPRSASQPKGIMGPSKLVDHAAFAWNDCCWRPPPFGSAVIYELHICTFTPAGTFDSAIERLSYLVELGVTHLELMPVAEFAGNRGWGYDGVDLFAPHQAYGGHRGLKRLVNACHQKGLAVLLDVVYNHLGPAGNFLEKFGPYFTKGSTTQWGEAVNLSGEWSDDVRRFFLDNALMWLRDYHFDGLRIDATHALKDDSAVHFLEELASKVKSLGLHLGKQFVLIAESNLNDPRLVLPQGSGGYGMEAHWCDDFHHALHTYLTGEQTGYYQDYGTLKQLAKSLENGYIFDGVFSPFRKRTYGRPINNLAGGAFVISTQTHDQVGNRAQGERLSHLVGPDKLKIAAAVMLLSPFVPMLFAGEEWGATTPFLYFTDHQDAELAIQITEGRRAEFPDSNTTGEAVPDPQAETTFNRSRLLWAEVECAPHRDLLEWHRALIKLRRESPELKSGARACVEFSEALQWLTIRYGALLTVNNLSVEPRSVPITGPFPKSILLATLRTGVALNGTTVHVSPMSATVFTCAEERS